MKMVEGDAELAARLATEAGALLIALQRSGTLDGKSLGNEGDKIANRLLITALRDARPGDGLLSEEEQDNADRLSKERVWIIDPLDGTREFSEGRDDWAVHVALSIGGVATIGAVALPGLGITLSSLAPPGLQPAKSPLRMVVSRTRPAKEAIAIAQALGAELLPMGSAGAKAMAVVRGEADIYLHSGGQYEWDNCAPIAVAQAAGLHCSRIDGSAMRYNRANPYLEDLLICRKSMAAQILDLVSAYRAVSPASV
jgi:3'(2'), 5'-bisphosphate nucleotidase